MKLLIAVLALITLGGCTTMNTQKRDEMLLPVLRVDAGDATGSATVVVSNEDFSLLLTNYHVIAGAMTRSTHKGMVLVDFYKYEDGKEWEITQIAEVVVFNKALDLALLSTDFHTDYVVRLAKSDISLPPFRKAWLVGAGLGYTPFPTEGIISSTAERGGKFTLISAPIVGGDSGGACFVKEGGHFVMIGVPSQVALYEKKAVNHMAWCIPIKTVRGFLERASKKLEEGK